MQKPKNKILETKPESTSNESRFIHQTKRVLFVLLAIIIFIVALVVINRLQISQEKYNKKESVEQITNKEPEPSVQPIILVEGQDNNSLKEINSHVEKSPLVDQQLIRNIENYRLYLLNANHLVVNFFQDKVFTEQLSEIKTIIKLPKEIEAILALFDEYNTSYLVNYDLGRQRIPLDNWLLDRFIKVEKLSSNFKNKEILRIKIIENLEIFINFLYSEELQNIFISKVSK